MSLETRGHDLGVSVGEWTVKGSFANTREFVKLRLTESKNGHPIPQFSKDTILDANIRNAVGIYFGVERISMQTVGKLLSLRANQRSFKSQKGEIKHWYDKKSERLLVVKPQSISNVSRMLQAGITDLHATASPELKQQFPPHLFSFDKTRPEIRKKQNILREWIDAYRAEKNLKLREVSEQVGLHLRELLEKPLVNMSLYSLQKILVWAENANTTADQREELRTILATIFDQQVQEKGKIYDRLPPRIPKIISKQLTCVTYTPTELARDIADPDENEVNIRKLAGKIVKIKNAAGLPTIFSEAQAQRVRDTLTGRQKEKENRLRSKSLFGQQIIDMLGLDPFTFSQCVWSRKEDGMPSPQEFGIILAKYSPHREKLQPFVETWLNHFRDNNIPVTSIAAEQKVSRQYIHQVERRVNPDGRLSVWETIEAIRKYRETNHTVGPRTTNRGTIPGHPRVTDCDTISGLAVELETTYSSIISATRALHIQHTRNLNAEEIKRIKEYRNNPPKPGRPRKQ